MTTLLPNQCEIRAFYMTYFLFGKMRTRFQFTYDLSLLYGKWLQNAALILTDGRTRTCTRKVVSYRHVYYE